MSLVHGGQLNKLVKQYGIAKDQWLDLSTGISPLAYPVPNIPNEIWQQLPQQNEDIILAAKAYYKADKVILSNGSQSIIERLPYLWKKQSPQSCDVFLPVYGYKEHEQAWRQAGFNLHYYDDELPQPQELSAHSVLLVINPNNPTGQLMSQEKLRAYQHYLADLNVLLLIDEAFMDVIKPCQSMIPFIENARLKSNNTIVLRSFGKFFGLAGIRIGFVMANAHWHLLLSSIFGPWQVNGPALYIAEQALYDQQWQQKQRQNLNNMSRQLLSLLQLKFAGLKQKQELISIKGTELFQTLQFKQQNMCEAIYHQLCLQGVYVRLSDDKHRLRFGIPLLSQLPRLSDSLSKAITAIETR